MSFWKFIEAAAPAFPFPLAKKATTPRQSAGDFHRECEDTLRRIGGDEMVAQVNARAAIPDIPETHQEFVARFEREAARRGWGSCIQVSVPGPPGCWNNYSRTQGSRANPWHRAVADAMQNPSCVISLAH